MSRLKQYRRIKELEAEVENLESISEFRRQTSNEACDLLDKRWEHTRELQLEVAKWKGRAQGRAWVILLMLIACSLAIFALANML